MDNFSDYIVYVDESGDSNWKAAPEYPLLCLNYCLFEKNYYLDKLLPRFNRLKFKYWGCDNIVLHERDLRKPDKIKDPAMKSKYEFLTGETRIEFMEEMSNLVTEAEFKCFCVIIDKERVPDEYRAYDPYNIALSRGFRQVYEFLSAEAPLQLGKELHFVFEKRGQDSDQSLSRAYQQILLQGALTGIVSNYDFSQFRLELMDKKANATGLQIADLTARPIGNHYLYSEGRKEKVDLRAAEILLPKMRNCSLGECQLGEYEVFHNTLPKK